MTDIAARYIELLKKSLLGELYIENELRLLNVVFKLLVQERFSYPDFYNIRPDDPLIPVLRQAKQKGSALLFKKAGPNGEMIPAPELRNFTELSHTMIGRLRLDNIQHCVDAAIADKVEGDLIETGIWRGGAVTFMRGLLAARGVTDRTVWAADSFRGVPPPSLPQDAGLDISEKFYPFLTVTQEAVAELFNRYGLLDDQVRFLPGWFKDTLSTAPIKSLAVLRLDGDLYESTMDALNPLYPKVASGGFVIVDDYHALAPCRQAADDYRARHGINAPLLEIDGCGVYWRKP